jgi:hypothetical protein
MSAEVPLDPDVWYTIVVFTADAAARNSFIFSAYSRNRFQLVYADEIAKAS